MFDGVVLHHAADHLLRLFKLMFLTVMFVKAFVCKEFHHVSTTERDTRSISDGRDQTCCRAKGQDS
jgi:hypothetical protein